MATAWHINKIQIEWIILKPSNKNYKQHRKSIGCTGVYDVCAAACESVRAILGFKHADWWSVTITQPNKCTQTVTFTDVSQYKQLHKQIIQFLLSDHLQDWPKIIINIILWCNYKCDLYIQSMDPTGSSETFLLCVRELVMLLTRFDIAI